MCMCVCVCVRVFVCVCVCVYRKCVLQMRFEVFDANRGQCHPRGLIGYVITTFGTQNTHPIIFRCQQPSMHQWRTIPHPGPTHNAVTPS